MTNVYDSGRQMPLFHVRTADIDYQYYQYWIMLVQTANQRRDFQDSGFRNWATDWNRVQDPGCAGANAWLSNVDELVQGS